MTVLNQKSFIARAISRKALLRGLLCTCCFGPHPAFAQTTEQSGKASESAVAQTSTGYGDIVVTARKKSERLRDVPLAITAIPATTLTDRNQSKLQDYYASVPGLNLNAQGNGQSNIAIRGITTGEDSNPAVGIVIDDVPFGSSSALGYSSRILPDLDPATLSQIEVLRGPQGTLYGASSIGGLLKFDTAAPSLDRMSGRLEGGINTVENGEIGFLGRGSVNVPVSSTLAVRASGFFRRDGGYVDNINGPNNVNRVEADGGHFSLLFKPTTPLSIRISALLQNTHGFGTGDEDGDYYGHPLYGPHTNSRIPGVDHYHIDARLYSANVSYDFGAISLTSLTGYGISHYNSSSDESLTYGDIAGYYAGTPYSSLANDFRTKKFSQEVRLSSNGTHLFEWTIGGFYTHENTAAEQNLLAIDSSGAQRDLLLDSLFPSTYNEIAGFGTVTVHLSDRFDIQAGGRYSDIRQTYNELDLGTLGGGYTFDQKSRNRKATYVVTPRFRINTDLMAYARVATGYRPGGPNPLSTADAQANGVPTQFGPDTTTNYEVGFKGSILDRVLTFDLAAYMIDWKDIQLSLTNPTNGFIYFINGPSARSSGVEGSIMLKLHGGLQASASASYNNATLTKDLPSGAGYGFDGDRLPFSAHFTGSIGMDQDVALSERLTATFGGTVTYVGKRLGEFGAAVTNPRPIFPSYTTLDLRAGLKIDHWDINLFANNVTDKRGIVGMTAQARQSTIDSVYSASTIRPRTIGLSIARTF